MTASAARLVSQVPLAGHPRLPLLLVGPSLGTSVSDLWGEVAARLGARFRVVGWDLPGHGENGTIVTESFTVADLGEAVLQLADDVAGAGNPFFYAGDSIGGAVGQQLLLDAPARVRAAALVCTSPRFGEPQGWQERAELVRRAGTAAVVDGSRQRWFGPGFTDRRPEVAARLLQRLRQVDPDGYAECCEALGDFDARERLSAITAPVLVISGDADVAAPADQGRSIADGVARGRLTVLEHVGHLAPVEAPDEVARLLLAHFGGRTTGREVRDAGMAVRRSVLGDAHVDRAEARTSGLTAEFQDLISRYAWGEIWTRPGLDRRSRSMITLTAMIARGHHEELAMHLRAARRNGLSTAEITEVILQSAIYCGVPDANTAFRIAQRVLEDEDTTEEGE